MFLLDNRCALFFLSPHGSIAAPRFPRGVFFRWWCIYKHAPLCCGYTLGIPLQFCERAEFFHLAVVVSFRNKKVKEAYRYLMLFSIYYSLFVYLLIYFDWFILLLMNIFTSYITMLMNEGPPLLQFDSILFYSFLSWIYLESLLTRHVSFFCFRKRNEWRTDI
jgi:hypothetical protein